MSPCGDGCDVSDFLRHTSAQQTYSGFVAKLNMSNGISGLTEAPPDISGSHQINGLDAPTPMVETIKLRDETAIVAAILTQIGKILVSVRGQRESDPFFAAARSASLPLMA